MLEFLLGVFSSVIGNLLTPSFKKWMRLKNDAFKHRAIPHTRSIPDPVPDHELEERRRYMREQWQIRSWTFFVYFVLIFYVVVALGMPLAIKTGFFHHPLECGELLIGRWCEDLYWESDAIVPMLIFLVLLCATGVWFLAQIIADPIANWIHYNRRHVDPVLYRRILGLTIIFLAFLLCGHWIYFLFPKNSYGISIGLPFFAVGMVGVLSSRR